MFKLASEMRKSSERQLSEGIRNSLNYNLGMTNKLMVEACNKGHTDVTVTIESYFQDVVKETIRQLTENGYKVEAAQASLGPNKYKVSW
jgi:hypothetical protein